MTQLRNCPDRDTLSAYLDREANPSEEKRVDLHLAECSRCRRSLRLISRMKVAVRNQPLPPIPADLRAALAEMIPAGGWRSRLESFQARLGAFGRPYLAYSLAGAAALAAGLWIYQRQARTAIPLDMILAAHNQYALTMPLASTEKIMADMPVQVSYAGGEELPDAD